MAGISAQCPIPQSRLFRSGSCRGPSLGETSWESRIGCGGEWHRNEQLRFPATNWRDKLLRVIKFRELTFRTDVICTSFTLVSWIILEISQGCACFDFVVACYSKYLLLKPCLDYLKPLYGSLMTMYAPANFCLPEQTSLSAKATLRVQTYKQCCMLRMHVIWHDLTNGLFDYSSKLRGHEIESIYA